VQGQRAHDPRREEELAQLPASFTDGVLEIEIHTRPEAKPRTVAIKS
jgi:hypothetical protein